MLRRPTAAAPRIFWRIGQTLGGFTHQRTLTSITLTTGTKCTPEMATAMFAQSDPHAARRHKLAELIRRGIDPWGQRFDDRSLVRECRARIGEIQFVTKEGASLELPDVERTCQDPFTHSVNVPATRSRTAFSGCLRSMTWV